MMQSVGSFLAIDIGASALSATQMGEDVVGNNISNASTPGYSEESVDLGYNAVNAPFNGDNGIVGAIGSGVSPESVTRASDVFLSNQLYTANGSAGDANAQSNWLNNIQASFNEPGNTTINTQLATFFSNFTNVQNNPSDAGVRTAAIQGGVTLAQMFQTASQQLSTTDQQISQNMDNDVSQINNYSHEIAQINTSIRQAVAQGDPPNALLDQRDQIVSQLSSLANVTVQTNTDSTVNIKIGGTVIVQGETNTPVTMAGLQANGDITGGDLGGLAQSQTNLDGTMTQLNNLASQLITQVNTLHEQGTGLDGTTGLPFFTGTNASNMGVNQTLVNNPLELAVGGPLVPPATTPATGDASTAIAIGDLANQTLGANAGALSGQTFGGYYNNLVTEVGASTAAAQTNLSTASATQSQITNQLDQVTGVNQDTELTSMMKYQNTYEAASKVISSENNMLQDLINNMLPA